MKNFILLSLWYMVLGCLPSEAKTIKVGPTEKWTMPAQVSTIAEDGDTVEIASGVYDGETAVWRQNNLTLRSPKAFAHLQAPQKLAEDKAIWVIKGNNVTVENIAFSGAVVPDRNGAGIRMEGLKLTVKFCYFHHNQDGILTSNDTSAVLHIKQSEFGWNGAGDGLSHNLYVGRIAKLKLEQCYFHEAKVGHLLKCRAKSAEVYYNYLTDGETGNSSYVIDFPNGGWNVVLGNVLIEGPNSENKNVIAFGLEKNLHPESKLHLIHNTVISRRVTRANYLVQDPNLPVLALNNLWLGNAETLPEVLSGKGNLYLPSEEEARFKDPLNHDFRLQLNSPAVDAGIFYDGIPRPASQYKHPLQIVDRKDGDLPDVGAYAKEIITGTDQEILEQNAGMIIIPQFCSSGQDCAFRVIGSQSMQLLIYSLTGQLLFRSEAEAKETVVPANRLSAGIYLVYGITDGKTSVKKWVVTR